MDISKDGLYHYGNMLLFGNFPGTKSEQMEGALAIHCGQSLNPAHGFTSHGGRIFFAVAFQ